MNYLTSSLQWFNSQNRQRQITQACGALLIIALTTLLGYWALSPSYAVLFNHLDNRDANQILSQLEQSNIAYQLRNNGSDILIDKQLIDKTRIKLMGSGLQFNNSVGFELFDKTDFGMTDFSQKINYQRALQGELERTISSLDEIKQARVHLVIPESHLFQQEDNLPRAAVTLHLNRALSSQQVRSIQQLVTASVAHLPQANVVIVDQKGNSLTAAEEDSSANHFTSKKQVEHYLNDKIMQMLHRIFSDEDVMVKIDATLNYDELQRELLKPQKDGMITHEKETQHSTTTKTDKTPANQDVTREKTYQFGSEKESFKRANGTIERLTISVVVPKNTPLETINQIQRLVKSVVGFDAKRGDSISVEALINPVERASSEQIISKPVNHSKLLTYIGIAGLSVLLGAAIMLRLKARTRRQQLLIELNQWLIEHG